VRHHGLQGHAKPARHRAAALASAIERDQSPDKRQCVTSVRFERAAASSPMVFSSMVEVVADSLWQRPSQRLPQSSSARKRPAVAFIGADNSIEQLHALGEEGRVDPVEKGSQRGRDRRVGHAGRSAVHPVRKPPTPAPPGAHSPLHSCQAQ
jgi:hypothetical protein